MRTLGSQAWESVTEMDGKFLKSFTLLLFRPGQLTADYLAGVRQHRLTPFQILVFANILFFLVAGLLGYSAFTTSLEIHTQATNFLHQPLAQQMVEHRLDSTGEAASEFAARFNDRVEIQAKSLVIIMVPMLALVVLGLNRSVRFGAVGHWVFATHVFAFMLVLQATLAPLLERLLVVVLPMAGPQALSQWFEFSYSILLFLSFGVYYHLASKQVHQFSTLITAVKALLFVVAIYWIFLIYRMVLFFTTFYSL
ncbi:DUF3667 domain-containing protein [Marinicella meishanensis]|uniref:DUF3667 domain-containing protein n=1 Tax=Marinicella meishanensis TaxID=2873263 RepID=UPI001CBDCF26|nr:DUF3667 domain-containing protein [Marinicella sp. NBU2979]